MKKSLFLLVSLFGPSVLAFRWRKWNLFGGGGGGLLGPETKPLEPYSYNPHLTVQSPSRTFLDVLHLEGSELIDWEQHFLEIAAYSAPKVHQQD